jgi:hypothetical protein
MPNARIVQFDFFLPTGFSNPTTDWIDLPLDSNTQIYTILTSGYLKGFLLRAGGIADAKYCVAGIRIDGQPSSGYYEWPSGGITPSWLNDAEGQSGALGSNMPHQLLKYDVVNNAYVIWADFPYPGWFFSKSLRVGARLTQRIDSGGTLNVEVSPFLQADTAQAKFVGPT